MSILEILRHVPLWVWPLLVALVVLGLSQTVARRVTLRRATIPSLALAAVSVVGVVTTFGAAGPAVAAWAAGGAVSMAFARAARLWPGIGPAGADGRLHLAASWTPLVLILGLFAIKFGVGTALALHPALAGQTAFAAIAGAVYGLFSGLFVSRAWAAWAAARAPAGARGPAVVAALAR